MKKGPDKAPEPTPPSDVTDCLLFRDALRFTALHNSFPLRVLSKILIR